MSDDEIFGIKEIFKTYGNVDPEDKFWDDLKKNNEDLFTYFYRLTILLHDPLKEHFAFERDYFYKYHDNKLKELFKKYKNNSRITAYFQISAYACKIQQYKYKRI